MSLYDNVIHGPDLQNTLLDYLKIIVRSTYDSDNVLGIL